MAQAGYTPIQLYFSTTAAAVPTSGNLANGELAINITDGKLYYKNNSGVVTLLAGATAGPAGGSNTQVQFNSSGVLAGDADLTFDGTTLTANALTVTNAVTLSGGTANGVPYLNGSKVLTSGSALTFSGQQFAISSLGDQIKISNSFGGTQQLTISSNAAGSVFTSHDGTSFVPIVWQSNTVEQMRLNSTGLGIGTSSPTYKLSVNSGATTTIGLFTSTGSAAYLGLANSGATTYIGNDSTSGSFVIQTPSGSFSTKLTVDNAGNLGLGVTPSAGGATANYRLFEIGLDGGGSIYSGTNQTLIGTNIAWSGGTPNYKRTGSAPTLYNQQNGAHSWSTAASGTAGNAITFTQAMTLNSEGLLTVGTTVNGEFGVIVAGGAKSFSAGIPQYQFQAQDTTAMAAGVGGAINFVGKFTSGGSITSFASIEASKDNATSGDYGASLVFKTRVNGGAQIERARITSDGTILIRGGSVPTISQYDAPFLFRIGGGGLGIGSAYETGGTSPIVFYTQGAERARISSTGILDIGTGAGAIGQIQFPATQVASANANTLDDYEEGSFTPAMNFAGSTTGITYSSQFGRYTKIGNVVTVQIGINLSSKGSAAGALQIAGLPFTAIDPGAYGDGSLAISFCSAATATTPMMAIVQRGNTQVALNFTTTLGSDSVENTDVTNSFAIIIGGSYISA